MVQIRMFVMGFASHQNWAEGYQRATTESSSKSSSTKHSVQVEIIPGDRWKWRMLTAATELESKVDYERDDILLVDGMLDVTTLVAMVNAKTSSMLSTTKTSATTTFNDKGEENEDTDSNPTKRQRRDSSPEKPNNDSNAKQQAQTQAQMKTQTQKQTQQQRKKRPLIYVYLHENQLTTPFTGQDRDRKHQTHWHYGIAHYRSLMVADGFIFNSRQHLQVFSEALPKLINEQCPRDSVGWHLEQATQLLQSKCTVLRYGLELEELTKEIKIPTTPKTSDGTCTNDTMDDALKTNSTHTTSKPMEGIDEKTAETSTSATTLQPPVILWNARLEEDKDPASFIKLLETVRLRQQGAASNSLVFRLIVLGTDPSKDGIWHQQIKETFSEELLFLGWCTNRSEYAHWLQQASIVVSTARHETFGISIVESAYCGALPLLPNRLSYPELFSPMDQFSNHFYDSFKDAIAKLINLLKIASDPQQRSQAVSKSKQAVAQYRWSIMRSVYNSFFERLVLGEDLIEVGWDAEIEASNLAKSLSNSEPDISPMSIDDDNDVTAITNVIEITNDKDPRIALYRPKSLRDHKEYHKQLSVFKQPPKKQQNQQQQQQRQQDKNSMVPSLHGGRRAMVRMLEAISMGAPIQPISFLTTPELASKVFPIQHADRRKGAPVYVADKQLINVIRGQKVNAGDAVLAMIQFPVESPLETLIANPPILVLEDVRNSENVGSILRTAFCLGITSIVASPTAWAALKDSRAARCSMGTMYYHRFYRASSSLATTLQELQAGGITVYGVEIGPDAKPVGPHYDANNDSNKNNKNPDGWAAVMGNEDVGMTANTRKVCDSIVFVPQAHGDSLNVGHAAAITMFELGQGRPSVKQHDGKAACT